MVQARVDYFLHSSFGCSLRSSCFEILSFEVCSRHFVSRNSGACSSYFELQNFVSYSVDSRVLLIPRVLLVIPSIVLRLILWPIVRWLAWLRIVPRILIVLIVIVIVLTVVTTFRLIIAVVGSVVASGWCRRNCRIYRISKPSPNNSSNIIVFVSNR